MYLSKIFFQDAYAHPAGQEKIIKQKIAPSTAGVAGLKISCLLHMKVVAFNFLTLVSSPIANSRKDYNH